MCYVQEPRIGWCWKVLSCLYCSIMAKSIFRCKIQRPNGNKSLLLRSGSPWHAHTEVYLKCMSAWVATISSLSTSRAAGKIPAIFVLLVSASSKGANAQNTKGQGRPNVPIRTIRR